MFTAKLEPTAAGRTLLAKAQQGAAMKFTGVRIGSGSLGTKDPDTLTDVITPVKTCPITSISRSGSQTRVKFVLSQDNSSAYYLREIALMAEDPDSGDVAYMYANDGANAELIPVPEATAFEREITIIVILANVETVTASVQSGVFAGKEEFDAHIQDNVRHTTDEEREKWNAKVGLGADGKIPHAYLPEQKKPSLEEADGTLSVSNGGTGKTSWVQNRILYASSATALGQLAFPGTEGSILRQNRTGAPYWSTPNELIEEMGTAKIASGSFSGTGEGRAEVALGMFLNAARKIILPIEPKILITNPVGPRTTHFTSSVLRQGSSATYGVTEANFQITVYISQHLLGNILYVGGNGTYGADIAGELYDWVAIA